MGLYCNIRNKKDGTSRKLTFQRNFFLSINTTGWSCQSTILLSTIFHCCCQQKVMYKILDLEIVNDWGMDNLLWIDTVHCHPTNILVILQETTCPSVYQTHFLDWILHTSPSWFRECYHLDLASFCLGRNVITSSGIGGTFQYLWSSRFCFENIWYGNG